MPSRPRAPATPAPTTAEGYEAPPLEVDEAPALDALPVTLPAAVVVALREAECTEEMVVVLREDEMLALMEAWTLGTDRVVDAAASSSEKRMGR
jgi:hypothetical protein